MTGRSDGEDAASEEVSEPSALVGPQHLVGSLESRVNGVPKPAGARDADLQGGPSGGIVEGVTLEGVRHPSNAPLSVHGGLSPLVLQIAKDPGKLCNLGLVEIQLVGHETERAPYAKQHLSMHAALLFLSVMGGVLFLCERSSPAAGTAASSVVVHRDLARRNAR